MACGTMLDTIGVPEARPPRPPQCAVWRRLKNHYLGPERNQDIQTAKRQTNCEADMGPRTPCSLETQPDDS